MKKTILLVLVAMVATSAAFAQSPALATLSHDGTLTTFYGAEGLAKAHSAAVAGDVITLSSGLFTATDITKAVSIRGVGMLDDVVAGSTPSVIAGNFKIEIENSSEKSLKMEGVYCSDQMIYSGELYNPTFCKCRFNTVSSNTDASRLVNASFVHCFITDRIDLRANCNAICYNSVVSNPNSYHETTANFTLINCVIRCTTTSGSRSAKSYSPSFIMSSVLENCYVYATHSGSDTSGGYYLSAYLPTTSLATNCLSNQPRTFYNSTNNTNIQISTDSFFKTFRGTGIEDEDFSLIDDAAQKYLGTDGTQIGIYGGILPFDKRPAYARFTKVEIPAEATNGTLPVKVEFATE